MFTRNRKSKFVRYVLAIILITGMFGFMPVHPAQASTLTVMNTNDSGAGSLRQAIADAVAGDTITFNASLAGQTITLASDLILDKDLTIDGSPLASPITVSGDQACRVFYVNSDVTATLGGLIIALGHDIGGGSGIYNAGALMVMDSTFVSNGINQSGAGGGIFNAGTLTVTNTTFYYNGNGAEMDGGGIYSIGTLTVTNSTFSYNSGAHGGGIYNVGILTVTNSTFSYNGGAHGGGGIYNTGTLNYTNTIIANSTSDCLNAGTIGANTNNLVEDGSCSAVLSGDPLLGPLADNGGPTQTMALLPGSPAIDAGNDAICAAAPVNNLDQRGVTRPQGGHCDIGAYEKIIYHVKWDATGANNGSSWIDAYNDLQSALSVAQSGDEIWVAAGTYKPTSGTDRTISFQLKSGIKVYGGFMGMYWGEGDPRNEYRDPVVFTSILSGDIGIEGNNNDNSYHVVVSSGTDNSTILDGFTITAGNANGAPSSEYFSGGGMYNDQGSPKLNGTIFTDNHAGFGGGIYSQCITGDNCVVDLTLTDVVFSNNTATGEGGGIATRFGPNFPPSSHHVSLTNVSFINNTASRTGGGMLNNGGQVTLVDVTFSGNSALGGGGLSHIPLPLSTSTLTNVTFNNNSAGEGGGGMAVGTDGPSQTVLTNVTFSNNSSVQYGGGIANLGKSDLLLTNTTFKGNMAVTYGGGIANGGMESMENNGTVSLISTTFYDNSAGSNGGAIYNESGNINLRNSILYSNPGGEIFGTADVTYSIAQGGYTGTGNIDADPLLGLLQNNGGFTQTMALLPGSPAIDAGDDTNCPLTDQRGVTRPFGSHCDIGSYEFNSASIDVNIGEDKQGNYAVESLGTIFLTYPSTLAGPVKVISTNGEPVFTTQVVTSGGSYNELAGFPVNQFTTEYWFPYYDHGYPNLPGNNMRTWILVGNPSDTLTAEVEIRIGGLLRGSYSIPPGANVTPRWIGLQGGPVQVLSNIPIFASQRVFTVPYNSFNEVMGFPANQFTTEYWFPWYDTTYMNTYILVGNTSASESAIVDVYIGASKMGTYTIAPNSTLKQRYPSQVDGPVRVASTNSVNIVASEFTLSGTENSFNEVMGYPFDQFDTEYWFPFYDHGYPNIPSSTMRTWILLGNPSDTLTANVDIYMDGVLKGTYAIAPGANTTPRWIGLQGGPVQVLSDIPIFASQRVFTVPTNAFNEFMGIPRSQFSTQYWFTWFDSVYMNNTVTVVNP